MPTEGHIHFADFTRGDLLDYIADQDALLRGANDLIAQLLQRVESLEAEVQRLRNGTATLQDADFDTEDSL